MKSVEGRARREQKLKLLDKKKDFSSGKNIARISQQPTEDQT